MPDAKRSCLISVEGDALLVANTGQPFSRLGVVAICASHLGTKHDWQPTDPDESVSDAKLVSVIRDRELLTYRTNPDRITSDFRGEEETILDYGGRAIWELFQNADDAMAPPDVPPAQLIGAKGIGFKSVLEVSAEPEIHSGPFHFQFSSKKTVNLLKERKLHSNPPPLTFRMPFEEKPDKTVKELLNKYSTVVRLPFRRGKKRMVVRWLTQLDPRFLLFCQYLEELKIVFSQKAQKNWTAYREPLGELTDCEMLIKVRGKVGAKLGAVRYRRWAETWEASERNERHSIAICLSLDDQGVPVPVRRPMSLHVFFATKERLPFNAIIHASFDLQQSRKHIREGESDDEIMNKLSFLLKRMVSDGVPANTILKAFVPVPIPDETSLSGKIWAKFKQVLQGENFVPLIGNHHTCPPKCHTWKFNIGRIVDDSAIEVYDSNLVLPEIQDDSHCREALSVLGTEKLGRDQYLSLLPHCLNKTAEQCVRAIESLHQVVMHLTPSFHPENDEKKRFFESCRKIACWWNQKAQPRALKSDVPLFEGSPKEETPGWLQLDYLDEGFLQTIESITEDRDWNWKVLLNGHLHDSTKNEFLHHCLIPAMEGRNDPSWWNKHGHDVLKLYKIWAPQTSEVEPVLNNDKRVRLGTALHLPTDKGWTAAIHCYAGAAWDGPSQFDRFFGGILDRGVILPSDKWPISLYNDDLSLWKRVLQYAGVSWEMKIFRWRVDEESGWPIKGLSGRCPFESGVSNELWTQYWSQLSPPNFNKRTEFDWDTTVHEQWAIEFFPDALPNTMEERLQVVRPIAQQALGSGMRYTFQKGGGYEGRNSGSLSSFAHWQLEKFPWVLTKTSLFYVEKILSPKKVYMPSKGLHGLLPEVDIKIPEGQEGRDLVTFLTQVLQVQESLPPPESLKWKEWVEALPNVASQAEDQDRFKKVVRAFFKALLTLPTKPVHLPQKMRVPCISFARKEEAGKEQEVVVFRPPQDVYWLDEHYFAEPATRLELIRKFHVFLLELNDGEAAYKWFNLERLSNVVNITPEYDSEDVPIKERVLSRYKMRYRALKAIDQQVKLPDPSSLNLKAVRNLKLSISSGDGSIASPNVTSWKERDVFLVEAGDPWRGLGRALSPHHRRGLPDFFENILKARNWKEVLERLREHGISEAVLHDLEETEGDDIDEGLGGLGAEVQEVGKGEPTHEKLEGVPEEDPGKGKSLKVRSSPGEKNGRVGQDQSVRLSGGISQEGQTSVDAETEYDTEARRIKGRGAEEWIRNQLKERLSATWKVSGPERDSQGRETDIVLRHEQFGEFHVEVKHMEAGALYWSKNEVGKARDHHGHYFIVICTPAEGGNVRSPYREYWLLDPLTELSGFKRWGYWLWQAREQALEIVDGWDIPGYKPSREATNFSFRINVQEPMLSELATDDFEAVREAMEKRT